MSILDYRQVLAFEEVMADFDESRFYHYGSTTHTFNKMTAEAANASSIFTLAELRDLYQILKPYRDAGMISHVPAPQTDIFLNDGDRESVLRLYSDKQFGRPLEVLNIGKGGTYKKGRDGEVLVQMPVYYCETLDEKSHNFESVDPAKVFSFFKGRLATLYPSVPVKKERHVFLAVASSDQCTPQGML